MHGDYRIKYFIARFEVVTAALLKIQVFWDVTLCCWVSGSRCVKDHSVVMFRIKWSKKSSCMGSYGVVYGYGWWVWQTGRVGGESVGVVVVWSGCTLWDGHMISVELYTCEHWDCISLTEILGSVGMAEVSWDLWHKCWDDTFQILTHSPFTVILISHWILHNMCKWKCR
jgi:hypothetical protein